MAFDVPSPGSQPPGYGPGDGEGGSMPASPPPGFGQTPVGPGGMPPDNYLVWAVLTTICCCLPIGIASIVFAAQVNDLWARGDAAGAMEASRKARKFAIIAAVVGAIVTVVSVIAFVAFLIVLGATMEESGVLEQPGM